MSTLFIVDNDKIALFALQSWFQKKGYDVKIFMQPAELMEELRYSTPDFILLDTFMAGEQSGHVCRRIKKDLRLPCTVYLFSSTVCKLEQFCEYRADGFILKRRNFSRLIRSIECRMHNAVKN